jgi:hypothetical protein
LRLREAAAISVLSDQSNDYVGEDFEGFTITKFDGNTITVLGLLGLVALPPGKIS